MAEILGSITMSLDGYVTGPDDRPGVGLGEGGERLHHWMFGGDGDPAAPRDAPTEADRRYIDETFSAAGAWLVGRAMYDIAEGWGPDPGFDKPVYVVTQVAPVVLGGGKRLFDHLSRTDLTLEPADTVESPVVTHLRYRVGQLAT